MKREQVYAPFSYYRFDFLQKNNLKNLEIIFGGFIQQIFIKNTSHNNYMQGVLFFDKNY